MAMLKKLLCLLLILVLCVVQIENKTSAQEELSPLQILILDLQDVRDLIEEGDNKTAITILKSSQKLVRKVKEFNSETKNITSKRIKKGISLLKKNENQKALDLIQTAFDELEKAGFLAASSLETSRGMPWHASTLSSIC